MTDMVESQSNDTSSSSVAPARGALFLRIYLGVLVFILPFKFGGFVGNGEQAYFPVDIWQWLFFTCLPCYLVPPLCGLGLLAALLIHRRLPRFDFRTFVPLVWCLPLLAGIPGLLMSTEQDYARQWYGHFAGVAAFSIAVWWSCASDSKLRVTLCNCLAVAALLVAVHGWRQHFGGLAAMQENMEVFSQEQGFAMQEMMRQKMAQTRVYGTFVDPNVYAAHLLLCFPLTLLMLANWAKKFHPPRLTRNLFLGGGAILFAGALFWSGSRGAVIGLAFGAGLAVWHWPWLRRQWWHWLLPVVVVALMLAGLTLLAKYRSRDGLKSASARMEYYQAAVKLWQKHPLTGAGLGEFFPWYIRLKPLGAEETRDPHNFFLSLSSQCGLLGALAALAIICLPLWLTLRPLPTRDAFAWRLAACAGAGAWGIHSLFQFNELIPATVCLVPLVCLFAIGTSPVSKVSRVDRPNAWLVGGIFFGLAIFAVLACWPARRISGERLLQYVDNRRNPRIELDYAMLREAGRLLPNSPVPPRMMMEIGQAAAKWDMALEGATEMVRRTPHRSAAHLRQARLLIRSGDWEKAAQALQLAELWYPGKGDVYVLQTLLTIARKTTSLEQRWHWSDLEANTKSTIQEKEGKLVMTLDGPGANELWRILSQEKMTYGDGQIIQLYREDRQ